MKTSSGRRRLAVLAALASAPGVARAHAIGVVFYSGMKGQICNTCHSGGTPPTVALTGPDVLMAGARATYTFTITGGAATVGGLDVSVDDAQAKLVAGDGTVVTAGEVTHAGPRHFTGDSVSWQFTLEAPPAAGTVTLYAAGNSCNGDSTSFGDLAAATTFKVTVLGAPSPDMAAAGEHDATDAPDGGAAGCRVAGARAGRGSAALAVPFALLAFRAARRRRRRD